MVVTLAMVATGTRTATASAAAAARALRTATTATAKNTADEKSPSTRRRVQVQRSKEVVVKLIAYYVVLMIAGDLAAYFLGLIVEYQWGTQVSLVVFLCLYFLFL